VTDVLRRPIKKKAVQRDREKEEEEEDGKNEEKEMEIEPPVPAKSSCTKSSAAMSSQNSSRDQLVKLLEEAWSYLSRQDKYEFFGSPVTEDIAPGYHEVVTQPMDLSTIHDKIATTYKSVQEMDDDVSLMVENAKTFNGIDSPVTEAALSLRASWRKKRKEILSKEEAIKLSPSADDLPSKHMDSISGTRAPASSVPAGKVSETKSSVSSPAPVAVSSVTDVLRRPIKKKAVQRDREKEEEEEDGKNEEKEMEIEPPVPAKSSCTKSSAAMSSQNSSRDQLVKLLEEAWSYLSRQDKYEFFGSPVTEDIAPGYHEVVTQPMDLSTIHDKIATTYKSVQEMDDDVSLMVENAKTFNGDFSSVTEAAILLRSSWRKKRRDYFNKEEVMIRNLSDLSVSCPPGSEPSDSRATSEPTVTTAVSEFVPKSLPVVVKNSAPQVSIIPNAKISSNLSDAVKVTNKKKRKVVEESDGEAEYEDAMDALLDEEEVESESDEREVKPVVPSVLSQVDHKSTVTGSSHQELVRVLEEALSFLARQDRHGYFRYPVTEEIAPGYHSSITQPMDLSTMRSKISTTYNSLEDFHRDVNLMINNAKRFNSSWTSVFQSAETLWSSWKKKRKEYFDKLYGKSSTDADISVSNKPKKTDGTLKTVSKEEGGGKTSFSAAYVSREPERHQEERPRVPHRARQTVSDAKSDHARISQLDALLRPKVREAERMKVNPSDDLKPVLAEGKLLISLCMFKDPLVQVLLRQLLLTRLEKALMDDKLPAADTVIRQTVQLLHISVDKQPRIPATSDLILRRCLPIIMTGVALCKDSKEVISSLNETVANIDTPCADPSVDALLDALKTVFSTWATSKSAQSNVLSVSKQAALALADG